MKTTVLYFFALILSFSCYHSVSAQEKRDTMELTSTIIPADPYRVTVNASALPYMNAGLVYFQLENDSISYGLRSFSGYENKTNWSVSIPLKHCNTEYMLRFIAVDQNGRLINEVVTKFSTGKCPNPNIDLGKKKKKK
jgi:hypothetical protein